MPKRIFLQDCRQAHSNWSQDIREVFKILNLTSVHDLKVAVNVINVKSQLMTIIENEWKLELESKSRHLKQLSKLKDIFTDILNDKTDHFWLNLEQVFYL